ncbi:MAG TPA: hypothetical protein VHK00_09620, partial [Miltoncostaeaceae bacterium]|nr:hypothetical protein [Miltoncostaeaceae bacterium]
PYRAVGERSDTIEGRQAATVYYSGPRGARVAYTIVAGPALDWPEGARRLPLVRLAPGAATPRRGPGLSRSPPRRSRATSGPPSARRG